MVASGQVWLTTGVPGECRGQSQRLEDLMGEERAVGLPRGLLDDLPEQHVSRAAVGEALPWRAEQRDAGEAAQQLAGGGWLGQVQAGQVFPVDQPAGMAEQVMHGDRFPGCRAVIEPVAYRVIHRQDAAVGEQQHRRRSELLGDRGDLKAGCGRAAGVRVAPGCPAGDHGQVLAAALEESHAVQGTCVRHGVTIVMCARPAWRVAGLPRRSRMDHQPLRRGHFRRE